MWSRHYDANCEGGGESAEEDELRDSGVVEKARETGGIGMIIDEILCLFLLRKLPIFISPLSFSPVHG